MSLTPQGLSFLAYITAGGGFVVSRIIRKAKLEVSEGGLELTTNQRSKVENPDIFKVVVLSSSLSYTKKLRRFSSVAESPLLKEGNEFILKPR